MAYFSALDLELQIHTAEALHASGTAHDVYLCGQCQPPRPALTVAPRAWRDVLAPHTEAGGRAWKRPPSASRSVTGYRYDGYDGSDESFAALQSAEPMRPRSGAVRYLGRVRRQP